MVQYFSKAADFISLSLSALLTLFLVLLSHSRPISDKPRACIYFKDLVGRLRRNKQQAITGALV